MGVLINGAVVVLLCQKVWIEEDDSDGAQDGRDSAQGVHVHRAGECTQDS